MHASMRNARHVKEQRTDCSPSKADNHGDVTGHTLAQGQPMVTLVPPNTIHDLEHCTNSYYQLHVDHGAVQFETSTAIRAWIWSNTKAKQCKEMFMSCQQSRLFVIFINYYSRCCLTISIPYRDLCFNIAVGFRILCVATRTVICNSQSGLFSFHRIINNNR